MIRIKSNQKEVDNVIFDLGAVMFDTKPREWLFNLGVAPEKIDRVLAVTFYNPVWIEGDRGTMSSEDLINYAARIEPTLKKEITAFVNKRSYVEQAIPENVEVFYQCKDAGCGVYILSNFSKEPIDILKKRNSFFADADGAVISCDYGYVKPEPEIYKILLDKYHLDPARSVFIDDSEKNIVGAEKAGINGILLPACTSIAPYLDIPEEE